MSTWRLATRICLRVCQPERRWRAKPRGAIGRPGVIRAKLGKGKKKGWTVEPGNAPEVECILAKPPERTYGPSGYVMPYGGQWNCIWASRPRQGIGDGLRRELAHVLVAQIILGAGKMLIETGDGPEVLRDRVTSPGGTTMAGVEALEQGGLRAAVEAAVTRAARRARELRGAPVRGR